MNITCVECRSVYRVDPARVPRLGVRARCAVCGGIMAVGAGPAIEEEFSIVETRVETRVEARAESRSNPTITIPARPVAEPTPSPPIATRDATVQAETAPPSPPAAGHTYTPRAPEPAIPVEPQPRPAGPAPAPRPSFFAPRAHPAAGSTPGPRPTRTPSGSPRPVAPPAFPPGRPAPQPSQTAVRPSATGAPTPVPPPQNAMRTPPVARPTMTPTPSIATPPVPRPSVASTPAAPAPPPPTPRAPAAPRGSLGSLPTPVVSMPAAERGTAIRTPINPFLANDPNAKARRLARALISDLVTYFPQRREEGLRDGTLKQLFREEIKKSYEEYIEQVGREFAESSTHFQEALNEILAGGQPVL